MTKMITMSTMKKINILVLATMLVAVHARAVPTTLTYAGVLTDSGVRVEGTHVVLFELFNDELAGDVVYSEEVPGLVIVDGELVAELGNNNLDDSVLDLPELWLAVTVDGTPLEPRVRLNSVPYALRAEAAQFAIESVLSEDALSLGGILADDYVTDAQLAAQLATLGLANGLNAGTGINITNGTVSIAAGGVSAAELAPGAVGTAALANLAVTAAKIANNTITSQQLAPGAVGSGQIAPGAVGTTQLAPSAVTNAQIADFTIGAVDLATSAVGNQQIADNAVTSAKIADGTIASADITDATIATADIADDAVTAAKIKDAIPVFIVTSPGCVEDVGTLRVGQNTCTASAVGCGPGQCRFCSNDACIQCTQPVCVNSLIGFLVSP